MAFDRYSEETADRVAIPQGYFYPYQYRKQYNVSKKYVNGRLVVEPQACDIARQETHIIQRSNASGQWVPLPMNTGLITYPYQPPHSLDGQLAVEVQNRARARFMGKVKGDTASMGITLATWKQSRDMIVDRAQKLMRKVEVEENLLRSRKRSRAIANWTKRQGNLYLEGLFGWMPLIKDISDAISVVSSHPLPSTFIRASAIQHYDSHIVAHEPPDGRVNGWSWRNETIVAGWRRTTITAKVDVSNPNLWLANRLGVLNVPAVAVDLVPWSWVVGMFWNQSQFVSQLTDTVGLSFRDLSITHTAYSNTSSSTVGTGWFMTGASSSGAQQLRTKIRSLSTDLPPVRPAVRTPDLDWGLAATALALVAQRSDKILGMATRIQKHIRSLDP